MKYSNASKIFKDVSNTRVMLVMIIPGNGNAYMTEIWYPYVKRELEQLGFDVIAKRMPDPIIAHIDIWLPFIKEQTQDSEDVILIGHSSGAIAIMRYLETHKVKGAVLIGAYHTDLDNELEQKSGYFDKPWDWEAIKKNAGWIIQFASLDDPFIPIEEARFVVSDKGDILSPKKAPETIAPAVILMDSPIASPIPISATPMVAAVVNELPITMPLKEVSKKAIA